MKKILLSLALATLGLTVNSYGQIIMSQTFGSPTVAPALPSAWLQSSTGSPAWQTSTSGGSTWGGLTGANNVPTTHGQFVIVDDAAYPNQLHDTLESPVFSLASYTPATVYLQYDYYFYGATNNSSGLTETCYVIGSSNGGTTWAVIDTVPANAWTSTSFNTHYASLSTLSGANCKIAFVYSDGGGAILGCALNNVIVSVPPAGDITLTAVTPSTTPTAFYQTGGNATFGGTMYNVGSTTITSFVAGYQVGAGTPVNSTISGVSVAPFTSYNFTIPTPYVVVSGSQSATIWVNEPGGATPTSADTMTTAITGVDSLQPKIVMIEEFNQASCDPCAEAAPNVDSVYANSAGISNMVRYHVYFPGRDCMDSVTLAPFVNDMINFYGVDGVPDAKVDGVDTYPGYLGGGGSSYLNSPYIQSEAALGSPFKIAVTPHFDDSTDTWTCNVDIKSFAAMPAGLVLRAALTIDTITYLANQSTESIPQTSFPQVAENMFPSALGNTLAAFTSGSTQTVTLSWTKNHAWGSDRSVWGYDSTNNGQIVVWVMDNTAPYVYQAAAATVSTVYQQCMPSMTGIADVCTGASITVSDVATGGAWSSSNAGVATIDASTGVVYAVTAGTTNIIYTSAGAAPCSIDTALTVVAPITLGPISGSDTICVGGSTSHLTESVSGGTWSSSNASVASISGTGIVTATSAGTATIEYMVTNACGTYTTTTTLQVFSAATCPLGVSSVTARGSELQVFPNPNSGMFTMNLLSGVNEEVHVVVTNIVGETVNDFTTLTNRTTDINLASVPKGIYLLSASTIHGKYITKVVIN